MKKSKSVREFLSDPEVKNLLKKGDLEEVSSYATSVGNITRDNDLRKFGADLLERLPPRG